MPRIVADFRKPQSCEQGGGCVVRCTFLQFRCHLPLCSHLSHFCCFWIRLLTLPACPLLALRVLAVNLLSGLKVRLRAQTAAVHFDPPEISAEARTRVPGLAASGAAEAGAAEGGAGEEKGATSASWYLFSSFAFPFLSSFLFLLLPLPFISARRKFPRSSQLRSTKQQTATEELNARGKSQENHR